MRKGVSDFFEAPFSITHFSFSMQFHANRQNRCPIFPIRRGVDKVTFLFAVKSFFTRFSHSALQSQK